MGSAFSCMKMEMTEQERQNRELEDQLKTERIQASLDFKILLLGAGESGKSTVVKQLKNIHLGKGAIECDEIKTYALVLQTNTIQSMRGLLQACESLDIPIAPDIKEEADIFSAIAENATLTHEHAQMIDKLWKSETIQTAYDHRWEIHVPDAAPYYFTNVYRFVEADFLPTEEDIVMARIRTTGMFATEFDSPPVHWRVVDVGGQRSERKKWIRFFDDVEAILFVVSLAGYNQVLFEDQTQNRMREALDLFEKIAKTSCFRETPIFLFLNKKDLFESMLRDHPITACFPEYDGPSETQACLEYIAKQFQLRLPESKSIPDCHFIAARAKKDVKYAFEDVKKYLVQKHSKSIKKAERALNKT